LNPVSLCFASLIVLLIPHFVCLSRHAHCLETELWDKTSKLDKIIELVKDPEAAFLSKKVEKAVLVEEHNKLADLLEESKWAFNEGVCSFEPRLLLMKSQNEVL